MAERTFADRVSAPASAPREIATRKGIRLSIVIPVYGGERTLGPLVHRLNDCLGHLYRLEIVLVNDASPDGTARVGRALAARFPFVKYLSLSRNFSEHNAVMAGLHHATGEFTVVMDDDFQNPPEEVVRLVNEIDRGYDVVFSHYEAKCHNRWRNAGSAFHNWVASYLIGKPRDLYLSSFKIMSRFLVDELVKYDGPHPYIDGLILRCTRRYSRVRVRHAPRREGKSGYTLKKLVALWLSMFTSFSILPLRLASGLGFLFSAAGLAIALVFALEKWTNPALPAGWASLIVSVFIIGGVQLFALGMIGEYLGRLFLQQNGKPQFVIREALNCDAGEVRHP